jgi:hypothetical protein
MSLTREDRFKHLARIIKRQTNDRLKEFRQYTLEIESKFDSDKDALSRQYNQRVAGLSADEVSEIDDYFSDYYYTIEDTYIGQHRRSTLVSIYSFLEHAMNHLCKHVTKKNGYQFAVEDLRGEGIQRASTYLKKTASADFNALNDEWSALKTLNKVRNCIVHNEGDVTVLKSSELADLVNKITGLSLRNDRLISVEREYVDHCITTVESFLDKLYKQVL